MSNKYIVLKALMDHRVEPINTPLGNEFIIDKEWLLEMDYDGAFAAIISRYPRNNERILVVFSKKQDEYMDEMISDIKQKIMTAINELQAA
ncbi:MAG: hypothetical protein K6F17_04285 [Lachnospiraceae bacterium]|nr:hypothetical protein [Lachnospiraceae bacterium]